MSEQKKETPSYRIKHIGIRTDSPEEARQLAVILSALLDLGEVNETPIACWAGSLFEVMNSDARGQRGHVALQTEDVEAVMAHMQAKGVEFDEKSIRRDETGRICFVYLKLELAGFQFHLTT